jgi:hypothetical protein
VEASLAQLAAAGISSAAFNSSLPPPSRGNGASGVGSDNTASFLSLSLQDVGAFWLDELDLDKSVYPSSYFLADPAAGSCASSSYAAHQAQVASAYSSGGHIKVEPSQASVPALAPRAQSPDSESDEGIAPSLLLPPLSLYHVPRPASHSSQTSPTITGSPISSFSHAAHSLSPALLDLLPSAPFRRTLLDLVHRSMLLRPSFNFPHFRGRIDNLFDGDNRGDPDHSPKNKAAVARAIIFGPPSTSVLSTPPKPNVSSPSSLLTSPTTPLSTISFFAAVAAAFALGSQISPLATDAGESSMLVDGEPGSRKRHGSHKPRHKPTSGSGGNEKPSPSYLYALSVQALAVHEERAPFDLDYLIACLLQVRFLLQGGEGTIRKARKKLGNTGAGGALFPLVRSGASFF